jgi:Fur family ferric uptake transcriptional regulator
MQQATQLLKSNGLRKTQIRLDVLHTFLTSEQAYGQGDIEQIHPTTDRISLYRTLKTFEDKGIIHQAVDGSGKMKYALCKHNCTEHEHLDHHAHFHCTNCEKTICLDSISVPEVELPKNYQLKQSHLVLSGICEDCEKE